jgi:hypothetical protein
MRITLLLSSAVFFASAAQASPLSGRGTIDSGAGEQREMRSDSPFAFFVGLFDMVAGGKSGAPSSDRRRDSSKSQYECDKQAAEEDKRVADAKSGLPAGPEPMYLAF